VGVGTVPPGPLSEALERDLSALASAVTEGAGFPAITRAAGRALGASLAVVDRSSAVLAIAALSPDEENKLRSRGAGVKRHRLRVDDQVVGELRLRWHGEEAPGGLLDLVGALIGQELGRSRSSDWADEEAAATLVDAVLDRELGSADEIGERAAALGTDLSEGAGVAIARLAPVEEAAGGEGGGTSGGGAAGGEEWAKRAFEAGLRGARSIARETLASLTVYDGYAELRAISPCAATEQLERVARAILDEVAGSVEGVRVTVGHSRQVGRPDELYRAGREALLAVNVAEAEESETVGFEETGSYRLLLSTMSENPAELEWFYNDTVAPLVSYDAQYGTDLVSTVETFLRNDGNIGPTAEELFAHRHTIRYRLGRVRDLCGYDIQSTDGRERLGFGLKVMRVLGIGPRRDRPLDIRDG